MELDVLKSFVRMHVELLVGGVWLDGVMMPIVKSVVTLVPSHPSNEFYGPTALKAESIQAIRQVKTKAAPPPDAVKPPDTNVKSGFESVNPASRFVKGKV